MSGVHFRHQRADFIERGKNRVLSGGWHGKHGSVDAEFVIAVHEGEVAVGIPGGDRDRGRIAARLGGHLPEPRDQIDDVTMAAGAAWHPAVTVTDRPPRGVRESAADQDRRMRLPDRLWPGHAPG